MAWDDAENRAALPSQGGRFGRRVVSRSIANIAFVASTKKITRGSGSFITDGYEVGQLLTTSAATNRGWFTIVTVAALEMTVLEAVADLAAATQTLNAYQPIAQLTNMSLQGADRRIIDSSHMLSKRRRKTPGLSDSGTYELEGNYLTDEKGQDLFFGDAVSTDIFTYIMALADHRFITFDGFARPMSISHPMDDKATFQAGVVVDGEPRRSWVAAEAA